eukprot:scaffold37111_cov270-Isochrysis_galbana.AAC.1
MRTAEESGPDAGTSAGPSAKSSSSTELFLGGSNTSQQLQLCRDGAYINESHPETPAALAQCNCVA